uniref:hypothetical protein n=1 Tax=Acetatifactor sp. TaxID=1872090 RepID=UPI0040568CF8
MKLILIISVTLLSLTGCASDSSDKLPDTGVATTDNASMEQNVVMTEETVNAKVNDLLDKFLAGEINADGNGLYGRMSFNISELPMSGEDWLSYSVGDRLDLDNDGEDEQILYGPYGGMYLDASDDGVKVFAVGNGTASVLSYTYCDNEIWIVHSDTTHGGRKYYELKKYSGADNVTDSVTLAIFEENETTQYYLNRNEISESEYDELYQMFFGERKIYSSIK